MRHKINKDEFRTALQTVGKIGENVDHDVVSHYQKETDQYDPQQVTIKDIWEEFLSYELHHILARIGFSKFLNEKHNIKCKIPGIDSKIDFTSFHNPWNSRLNIQTEGLERDLIIKGLQPHYKWVNITEKQYRSADPENLIGAARIFFRGKEWGNRTNIEQPQIVPTTIQCGDSTRKIEHENQEEITSMFRNTNDYGRFAVYKFNKEINWMVDYNSPVEVNILGLCRLEEVKQYDDSTPETFSVDYSVPIEKLSTKSAGMDINTTDNL
jgi:hypothetical protein